MQSVTMDLLVSYYINRWLQKKELFGIYVNSWNDWNKSSYLHRASIVPKTLFIVPTDAHYYKIMEMLKQYKIIILARTCFGSRRNYHQEAVLFLTKTTEWLFPCSSVVTQSIYIFKEILSLQLICRHNIDCVYTDEHGKIHSVVLAKHRTAP